jgi:membrane-bound lytic murein transglycosylase D
MGASIKCRSGSLQGKAFNLEADVTLIGRNVDNHVVFEDEIVSSVHAEIRRKGGRYYLVDRQSTNGTLVNGRPVDTIQLGDRDRIELGEGGPVLEFRGAEETRDERPTLVPLSGTWPSDMSPVPLDHGSTSLGRSPENDIVLGRGHGSVVSSQHAIIAVHTDHCEIEDLNSSNGTFVNGGQIQKARLKDGDQIEFGSGGPTCKFQWSAKARGTKGSAKESDRIFKKLERAAKGGHAGEQTMMFLQVANKYYKRKRWPLVILSGVVLVFAAGLGYLYYGKVRENQRLRASAKEVFYQMRSYEMKLVQKRDVMAKDELAGMQSDRRRAELAYDQFLKELGLYEGKTQVQVAIMRLARRLGETDLEVPPDFYKTTMTYVERWRGSARLRNSLDRARQRSLPQVIRTALNQYGLPREFFFLPLQESGYNREAVGPQTNFGIAKGMWQMIPATALDYHLRLGPLKDLPQYDASDERHDEIHSTQAAVRYLAYLYSTKTAASGLLVIAAYNFGQTRIIKRLDELPNDPRQRNFWNFYRNGWIPSETRDYVMAIFSAALICEKPDLFQMNVEPIMPGW